MTKDKNNNIYVSKDGIFYTSTLEYLMKSKVKSLWSGIREHCKLLRERSPSDYWYKFNREQFKIKFEIMCTLKEILSESK